MMRSGGETALTYEGDPRIGRNYHPGASYCLARKH